MPSRVWVKICGICREEDLILAVNEGANAVGFIVGFPSSKRNLSISRASELMKKAPPFVMRFVVTRDEEELLKSIVRSSRPDALQLYGDGIWYRRDEPELRGIRMIKALDAHRGRIKEMAVRASQAYDAIHLDSLSSEGLGGTGRTHDWNLSREIREAIFPKPLILSGGLKPENVSQAIRLVRPFGVDVASGVESKPGVKDHILVERFIEQAGSVVD